jgi:ribosomal protein L16 Arg81 hydroxylase
MRAASWKASGSSARCLLRGALAGINSPLDADELAGLACEPEVESRIVREQGPDRPWQVDHGPFDEAFFATLPDSHWTLLVQDADKHVPQVAELLACFDFLPEWRLDDIMISWAADGGSVGPHLDEYDVFLLQVQGRDAGASTAGRSRTAHSCRTWICASCSGSMPTKTGLLKPGDLLYLPPGRPALGHRRGALHDLVHRPARAGLARARVGLAATGGGSLGSDTRWRDPPHSTATAPAVGAR